MTRRSCALIVWSLLGLSFLSGCDRAEGIWSRWRTKLSGLFSRTSSQEGDELGQTRAHALFVNELYNVVWKTKPNSPDTFKSWVHTLNEGASYEGIYRGFTRNQFYRELETRTKGAHPAALSVFLRELGRLAKSTSQPRVFAAEDGLPLAKPMSNADLEAGSEGVNEEVFAKAAKTEAIFAESSPFTMARVLGEEALRVIAEQAEKGDEALYRWYGQWAADTAGVGVDFGLEQRGKKDAQFHESWAKMASRDVLVWEVLNRVHRLIHSGDS